MSHSNNKKDIVPYKVNGQPHGLWILHWGDEDEIIGAIGHYVNGKESGYWKEYDEDGKLQTLTYYII